MDAEVPPNRLSSSDAERDGEPSDSSNWESAESMRWHDDVHAAVVLDSIADGVLSTDAARKVVCLNRAAERMTGWLWDQAKGRSIIEVFQLADRTTRRPPADRVALAIEHGAPCSLKENTILVARDGTEFEIEGSVAPVRARDGRIIRAVLVFRHVGRARAVAAEMSHRAHHDFLTGLPNAVLLEDRIGRAIELARRHSVRLAVLFIDLDNFKRVNDTLGHSTGDELLRSVAKRLKACLRISDTVCRRSGDEFVVLLSEIDQAEDAAGRAATLMAALAAPHRIAGRDLIVSASVGVAVFPSDGSGSETLLLSADEAMYQAKRNGRNCFRFATTQLIQQGGTISRAGSKSPSRSAGNDAAPTGAHRLVR